MKTIVLALLAATVLVGCGGEKRITADDKEKIGSAGLTLSLQCMSGDPDVSEVENAVTDLLDARDEFGDQKFTLSDSFQNVTVQDIMDRESKIMAEHDCVPDQRERLD